MDANTPAHIPHTGLGLGEYGYWAIEKGGAWAIISVVGVGGGEITPVGGSGQMHPGKTGISREYPTDGRVRGYHLDSQGYRIQDVSRTPEQPPTRPYAGYARTPHMGMRIYWRFKYAGHWLLVPVWEAGISPIRFPMMHGVMPVGGGGIVNAPVLDLSTKKVLIERVTNHAGTGVRPYQPRKKRGIGGIPLPPMMPPLLEKTTPKPFFLPPPPGAPRATPVDFPVFGFPPVNPPKTT